LATAFDTAFGADSEYGPLNAQGRPMPLQGPWRHGSLKKFAALRAASDDPLDPPSKRYPACGLTSDSQADCLARAVPVAALFAGRHQSNTPSGAAASASLALASAAPGSKIPDESAALLDAVAAVTRVTQNTDVAVAFAQAFAAALGEVVASGATPAQALAAADAALLAEDGRMLGGEASRCSDDAVDAAAAARASARAAVGTARALAADQSFAARTGGGAEEPFLAALLAYAGAPSLGAVPTTPIA
jgi:hypothetical protein